MKLILILLFIISLLSGNAQVQVQSTIEDVKQANVTIDAKAKSKVSFTLSNKTDKSIPLIIPNVMNPNLSPNSESAVTLRFGQEILFKYKGKKRVLLTVDDSINDGETLDVAAILTLRREEINRLK